MKILHYTSGSNLCVLLTLVLLSIVASGCSFNRIKYVDGPLAQYLTEPIPALDKPVARTLSVEKIRYNTADSMKGIMISDLVAREIYILPNEVGIEIKKQFNMDNEFSTKATYAGLNTIARSRAKARHMWDGSEKGALSNTLTNTGSHQHIVRHESMAKAAYDKGDYMAGNIHNAAAESSLRGRQEAERTQAVVDMTFSVFNAVKGMGEALIKSDFINLRNWIESSSGAIGEQAPPGTHLSVFFLSFFDTKSFQLDSRSRVAVFMVLTDKKGVSTSVLKGSDILFCNNECNLFKPKPGAKLFDLKAASKDVFKLFAPGGYEYLNTKGFGSSAGAYHYILLQHGLQEFK